MDRRAVVTRQEPSLHDELVVAGDPRRLGDRVPAARRGTPVEELLGPFSLHLSDSLRHSCTCRTAPTRRARRKQGTIPTAQSREGQGFRPGNLVRSAVAGGREPAPASGRSEEITVSEPQDLPFEPAPP